MIHQKDMAWNRSWRGKTQKSVIIETGRILTHQSVKFVKCDTTGWEDQVGLFREAANMAPDGKISYVVANAGIASADDVFSYEGNVPNRVSSGQLLTWSR